MNEAQAIRLCIRHRDPVGFEFLVDKYRREAYCHALALMGNREDAADACQESFRRAFAAIPKLAHMDQFYPWFYRILRNCCLNMLNRRKTVLQYARDNSSRVQGATASDNPASILAKEEEASAVRRALDGLSAENREILSLKYIMGKSYEDIAQCLNIPRGTVMSRLFYARKAFRDKYLQCNQTECNRAKGAFHE